jgi:hypothetical protein
MLKTKAQAECSALVKFVDPRHSYKWTLQPEILRTLYRSPLRRVSNLPLLDQKLPDAPAPSNAVTVPRSIEMRILISGLCFMGRSYGIAYTPRRVLGKAQLSTDMRFCAAHVNSTIAF